MNRWVVWGTAILLQLGCDAEDPACLERLDAWCERADCGQFGDVVAAQRADMRHAAGTFACGDRFIGFWVHWGDESLGPVSYYDRATGDLVAVHTFSDVDQYCDGTRGDQWYGRVMSCDQEIPRFPDSCFDWSPEPWSADDCHFFMVE